MASGCSVGQGASSCGIGGSLKVVGAATLRGVEIINGGSNC